MMSTGEALMTTKEHDTDPSTPSARRPVNGRASGSTPPPPDTDPGVAPPAKPSAPPLAPLGIIVPAPSFRPPRPPQTGDSPVLPRKDSVELLLDGMAGQSLDRARTTPQTDGQASASYHAEHTVRAAEHPPVGDEPKVLFERPSTPVTMRVARPGPFAPPARVPDATVVIPANTMRRVLVALGAGMAVVIALFVVLKWATHVTTDSSASAPLAVDRSGVTPASDIPTVASVASPASSASSAPMAGVPIVPAADPVVAVPPVASASSHDTAHDAAHDAADLRPVPAPAQPAHRRARSAAAGATGDIGEFKTTY